VQGEGGRLKGAGNSFPLPLSPCPFFKIAPIGLFIIHYSLKSTFSPKNFQISNPFPNTPFPLSHFPCPFFVQNRPNSHHFPHQIHFTPTFSPKLYFLKMLQTIKVIFIFVAENEINLPYF